MKTGNMNFAMEEYSIIALYLSVHAHVVGNLRPGPVKDMGFELGENSEHSTCGKIGSHLCMH